MQNRQKKPANIGTYFRQPLMLLIYLILENQTSLLLCSAV